MPVPRKPSKVDERLKAAEARRTELQRQRDLEVQAAAERKKGKTVEAFIGEREKHSSSQRANGSTNSLPLRNSRSNLSRSQSELAKKPKLAVPHEQPQSKPESPCQCQVMQRPLCFTKSGEFIPGKFMKCNQMLIPVRQHRPWLSFKRQVQKLFTIKQIEDLLQRVEQLEVVAVMIDILRRSCSSRHPIQNKFLQLESKLLALERSRAQLEMRRRSDSISPLDSPKFSCNLNDLRSPGSSMEALYTDGDGLFSNAAIDEITSRHNLSPIKNRFALKPSLASNAHLLQKTPVKQQTTFKQQASSTASLIPRSVPESGNNFKTVLSPRKHQIRDLEAQTVLTPLRKSLRTTTSTSETEYTEEKVAELLLQDDSVAFVSNPYIKSSPTKRNRGQGN